MSQQNEIGTLVVVVLKAQHLHQPSFYKQDPYGQASLGGLKKRTKTAPKGGQHPVWDEELRFPVLADVGRDKANRILEVACYKEVQRGEDVLLGKGTVDIEETLKAGEFDDWVPLETAAGARGEVYLEMTFYANSPPPVTRRPSKLSPSDRLAHPAQGGHPLPTTPVAVSPQSGRSPIAAERKLSQPPLGSGNQIPASLIPALGPKSQGSKQTLPGAPVATGKHRKDSLPPLPADDTSDVGSDKDTGFPVALQPGGRSGPRPMPPQNRNRVTSVGLSPPESLPGQPSRVSLSGTPALRAVPPFTLVQTPTQPYSPETTPMTGKWPGLTPSIVVEEHPSVTSPTSLPSPLGPSQAYTQQAFISAPAQGFSRTLSPFQSQPKQHYGVPLPHYQQYTQYLSGPTTSQPLPPSQTYPQLRDIQPGQQQPSPPYSSQQPPYPPQPQHHPPYQPYLPLSQQQYHSQQLPYTQTPHPPQVQQPYEQYNLSTSPSSNQPVATQQPLNPQTQQSYLIPPPPPQVQSPAPQTYTQPYFLPPPPPPPPPTLHNQDRKGSSIPPLVVQPLQTPIPLPVPSQGPIPSATSLQQTVTPATPTLQSSITPSHSQVTPNNAPPTLADTQVILGQNHVEERRSVAERVTIAEAGVMTREAREVQEDAGRHQITHEQNENVAKEEQRQTDTPKLAEEQGVEEERRREGEQQQGMLKRQGEEQLKQREMEHKGEEEERTGEDGLLEQEELRKREGECKRMEEDEQRRRAEEGLRKKNEEERRQREEERRRGEEEERRRMEEERRRREEEERMKMEGERRRKEEERERREEDERRRREDERRRQEDERRRQEEERIQREREEAERRREIEEEARRRCAEEAEAERRWQEELARIRARVEQEAADAAFARAQMEADEAERRRQEEADLAFLRRAQEEVDREEIVARERTRQVEADMEVARREQAHEEELERRRQEEADRELARRLDMELNLGAEPSSSGGDWSQGRRAAGARGK